MKKYILFAGVNGAGKSTLYQTLCLTLNHFKNMPRINADEIARSFGSWENYSDVMKAGKIAVNKILEYLEQGITFNQETTLCGNSIVRHIEKAKLLGYEIELHYVGLNSVELAKERIACRVAHGGHGIPEKDVERRYINSLGRLKEVISMCDLTVLYDNTRGFKRFAIFENGELSNLADEQPDWYKMLF